MRPSPTRTRILQLAMTRPRTVCEIARRLAINKSAIHRHLQLLVAQDALLRAPHGRWVYYRLGPGAAHLLEHGPAAPEPAAVAPPRRASDVNAPTRHRPPQPPVNEMAALILVVDSPPLP